MNILLINPWITDFAAHDFWIKPLGLLYVGAFLKKRGHNVSLIDCMDRFLPGSGIEFEHDIRRYNTGKFHREIIPKPECLNNVPRYFCRYGIPTERFMELLADTCKPDVILVTSIMTYWYHGVFEAIEFVRRHFPGVPVVLGGIYARLCEKHAREKSGADVVITTNLPSGQVDIIESTYGIYSDISEISDTFSGWPEPLWELYGNLITASVLTTRGCPFNCTVCASKLLFNGFERRDPLNAAGEITGLAERGVMDIAFCDDALLINTKTHAVPLFEAVADSGTGARFHTPNGLHVREITPELAKLMKKAGFVTIRLSLETASQDRSSDFSDKVSRDEFRAAAKALYEAGFDTGNVGAYIMAGLPGQEPEEVYDSVRFANNAGVTVKPALFSPVPGTVEFDRAVTAGIISPESDPVLHNKSLRTVDYFKGGYEGYKEFKRFVSEGNERVIDKFQKKEQ